MLKLSTSQLKAMITNWLSTEESKAEIAHLWKITAENAAAEAAKYGFKQVKTVEELSDALFNAWRTGKNWKRQEKSLLKNSEYCDISSFVEEVIDWEHPSYPKPVLSKRPAFPTDVLGQHSDELVQRYFNDQKLAERCIHRLFVPHDIFADNYRLEVITTHDDIEVVGWWVTVD